VNRWDVFRTLCGHLRGQFLGGPRDSFVPGNRWAQLINVSSQHYVTPALAWCLKDRIDIPSDIRRYFDAVLFLNGRRNERLLAGLLRVVAALNARGIEPVLLKGAARLVDGSYPTEAVRFLGDLDILISQHAIESALNALRDIEFGIAENDPIGPSHHHLPMLHERDSGVGVELHTHLTPPPFDAIVPTTWFWEGTRPFRYRNVDVCLSDATRAVAHNIVHDQLVHGQYGRQGVELRQLLDFALIRAQHESEIDWREIDRRFCNLGMGPVVATYADFANVLLGQPAPPLGHAPKVATLKAFKRRMGTLPTMRRLANDYVSARRREPLGFIRLFNPQTWTNRIRLIKSAFDSAV
jgi:hypothetical protein